MADMEKLRMSDVEGYETLLGWKPYGSKPGVKLEGLDDDDDGVMRLEFTRLRRECLEEMWKACVYLKKAAFKCDNLRIKLQNN